MGDDDDVIEGQEARERKYPIRLGRSCGLDFCTSLGLAIIIGYKCECKFERQDMEGYPHAIDSLHLFKTECLHSLSFGLVISYAHSTKLIV